MKIDELLEGTLKALSKAYDAHQKITRKWKTENDVQDFIWQEAHRVGITCRVFISGDAPNKSFFSLSTGPFGSAPDMPTEERDRLSKQLFDAIEPYIDTSPVTSKLSRHSAWTASFEFERPQKKRTSGKSK